VNPLSLEACISENTSKTGCFVSLKLQPGAKKSAFCGLYDAQHIKIQVRSAPVDGAANENLIEFFADSLGIKKSDIELVSGQKSRIKRIFVGMARPELVHRLSLLCSIV